MQLALCDLPATQTDCGAEFSPCRRYRYKLWRIWGSAGRYLNFLMLNPSTADEFKNDPTVAKCEQWARAWGYDGLFVTNIFAWRDTDPRAMKQTAEPVGVGNNAAILEVATGAALVVCAWGNDGAHLDRSRHVLDLLQGLCLHCMRVNTATGQPTHPLYLPLSLRPEVWRAGATKGEL